MGAQLGQARFDVAGEVDPLASFEEKGHLRIAVDSQWDDRLLVPERSLVFDPADRLAPDTLPGHHEEHRVGSDNGLVDLVVPDLSGPDATPVDPKRERRDYRGERSLQLCDKVAAVVPRVADEMHRHPRPRMHSQLD